MKKYTTCEYRFLNFFTKIESVGPVHLRKIVNYFGSAKKAYNANINQLQKMHIRQEIINDIIQARDEIDVKFEMELLEKEGINILSESDTHYPRLLKEITTPPLLIYFKGNLSLLNDKFAIAVVGSRKCSDYGRSACNTIIPKLCRAGITIVSGMALGIDAYAHTAAINNNGRTIAVLGSGIDKGSIYPKTNYGLAKKITQNDGLIISEFPYGSNPLPFHFPIRNRIISGISLGTLVIEAGEKSGSLITAFNALEQNREVYALPGSIYSHTSKGTNKLIQNGAKLVQCAEDILEEMQINNINAIRETQQSLLLTTNEETILNVLKSESDIDHILHKTSLSIHEVSSTLSLLEIKGLVQKSGVQKYIKL